MSAQGDKPVLGFVHRFEPSAGSPVTLLLLHGTGGDEDDLIGLGKTLLPGAALLSPRGKVLENGMPRFFRRLSEGVFDMDDLARRTHELAEFVDKASKSYGFDTKKVVAAGYSNGANIAASVLLSHPGLLAGAVLMRVMDPFTEFAVPDLTGKKVLIEAGTEDKLIPKEQPEALARLFEKGNAVVALHWQRAGHQLTQGDVEVARKWLSEGAEEPSDA
jgi:phospholipase/carboxylesterase